MSKFIDLTGQKFGRLFVIRKVNRGNYNAIRWECLCDCGNNTFVSSNALTTGSTKSCGCYQSEWATANGTKHGMSRCRFNKIYIGMVSRCNNPNNSNYHKYGGRGIKVCERWLGKNGFINFRDDMLSEYKNGLSIDRIDNNGNYCPENCRWADLLTQSNNKRNSRKLTLKGVTLSAADWARKLEIKAQSIYDRLSLGWNVEETLTHPPLKQGQNKKK